MKSQDLVESERKESNLDFLNQPLIPQDVFCTRFANNKEFTLRLLDIRHYKIKEVNGDKYKTKYIVMLGSPRYDYEKLFLYHHMLYEFNFPLTIFNYAWQCYSRPRERMLDVGVDYDLELTFKRVNSKRFEFVNIKLFPRDKKGNSDIWKLNKVIENDL